MIAPHRSNRKKLEPKMDAGCVVMNGAGSWNDSLPGFNGNVVYWCEGNIRPRTFSALSGWLSSLSCQNKFEMGSNKSYTVARRRVTPRSESLHKPICSLAYQENRPSLFSTTSGPRPDGGNQAVDFAKTCRRIRQYLRTSSIYARRGFGSL